MQYLCLIYESEALEAQRDEATNGAIIAEYMAFTESIKASGNLVAGDALMPTETATTIRIRDNQLMTTDGPFAETKEQLGGYYLIEAHDLDTAIEIAARIPAAKTGSIEVRPIMVFS